jgi:hypothetical protein
LEELAARSLLRLRVLAACTSGDASSIVTQSRGAVAACNGSRAIPVAGALSRFAAALLRFRPAEGVAGRTAGGASFAAAAIKCEAEDTVPVDEDEDEEDEAEAEAEAEEAANRRENQD